MQSSPVCLVHLSGKAFVPPRLGEGEGEVVLAVEGVAFFVVVCRSLVLGLVVVVAVVEGLVVEGLVVVLTDDFALTPKDR